MVFMIGSALIDGNSTLGPLPLGTSNKSRGARVTFSRPRAATHAVGCASSRLALGVDFVYALVER
jgi:hypothetical protein